MDQRFQARRQARQTTFPMAQTFFGFANSPWSVTDDLHPEKGPERDVEHIDRLRGYRSSLISAAITGQPNIGASQAKLPEAA